MALRDYAKFAPILIMAIAIILIIFVVISGIAPSLQYPGKNVIDIITGGIQSIIIDPVAAAVP